MNQHIFKVSPSAEADQGFLFYVIKHVAPKLADFDAHGSTMRHIKKESLGERVFVPPVSEQIIISKFLDRETAKIDALAKAFNGLIDLLKEKRQAVISHAVTKGLDPLVPMKDSGVEWLGRVPVSWKICRFRDLCLSVSTGPFGSALNADEYVTDGIPVINPSHIGDNCIIPDIKITVSDDVANRLNSWRLKSGNIVVARRGELGRSSLVCDAENGWICGTGSMIVRPNLSLVTADFLQSVLSSKYAKDYLGFQSVGSTMPNLNESILGSIPCAVPKSVGEQIELVLRLNVAKSEIDRLIHYAEGAIELLQERRTALISAAVTGKIDVRGLVEVVEEKESLETA